MINERDRCKPCKGKKVQTETKILEVHVDKGMKDGQKILFRGEGDQQVLATSWPSYWSLEMNEIYSFYYLQPGVEAGDVVIILQQKAHEKFKRQGDDLYVMHTISLTEALCGFCYVLKVFPHPVISVFSFWLLFVAWSQHLDGRELVIRQSPGNVVTPGSTKMVPGEGMPRYRSPFEKGELFIKFDVEFPASHFADESTILVFLIFIF